MTHAATSPLLLAVVASFVVAVTCGCAAQEGDPADEDVNLTESELTTLEYKEAVDLGAHINWEVFDYVKENGYAAVGFYSYNDDLYIADARVDGIARRAVAEAPLQTRGGY